MNETYGSTRCRFGAAQCDITPPDGIYSRTWGAATHEASTGVHRPFKASAAVIAPLEADEPMLAIVSFDIGWFPHGKDERALRHAVIERTGLSEATLLLNMSHTHAGANVNSELDGFPGSELIKPYLAELTERIGDIVIAARESLAPGWLTYGAGRCSLATNRDLFDADAGAWGCGYNPDVAADDTVLVVRATDDSGAVRATFFNYACHPTTLAWENQLLSPDYVGAAREVLESAYGAPALFLQGALGDLAPRDNYVGDSAVADSNGRQLGFAAAAAIENLPPPGTRFAYTGLIASGANLAGWAYEPCGPEQVQESEQLEARLHHVVLPRKEELGVVESLSSASPTGAQEREKALRRHFLALELGDGPTHAMPLWAWRLGGALLVAIPNEAYSRFQVELREQFAGTPVLVLNTTNGGVGYLPPRETYGQGRYQEQQSPYAPGCLEQVTDEAAAALRELRPPPA
jgi:hypothetical protein